MRHPYALVFENLDGVRLQRMPDSVSVVPPIMITKHRDHPKSCLQSSQFISNGLRINKTSTYHTLNDEVAKYHYEVRLLGIGRSDNFFELTKISVWCAHVEVRHDRDLETGMLGMPWMNGNCSMYHYQS